ncbi:hypothetical protein ACQPUC_00310, partial [Erwinia amylovora]
MAITALNNHFLQGIHLMTRVNRRRALTLMACCLLAGCGLTRAVTDGTVNTALNNHFLQGIHVMTRVNRRRALTLMACCLLAGCGLTRAVTDIFCKEFI